MALQRLEDVLPFEHKMTLFARHVRRGTLSYFPSLREFKEEHNHINFNYLQCAVIVIQAMFGERFNDFRFHTLFLPVTPLDIDPSLLNISEFTGASQPKLETEPADIADKDSWVSKPNMTADLEKVACQKATFTKEFK